MDVCVIAVLLLQCILAVANIRDVVDLCTARRIRQTVMLREILAIDSAGDCEQSTLFTQSMDDPAVGDVLVAGRGGSGLELLFAITGVRECEAVRLKHEPAALSQVATH